MKLKISMDEIRKDNIVWNKLTVPFKKVIKYLDNLSPLKKHNL